jgi:predicted DNA-binding antitoxin AbrB/MazE fold protein
MVVHAVYENGVFRPLEPVELTTGLQVEVRIVAPSEIPNSAGNPAVDSVVESQLLEQINQGLSETEWQRYHALIEKRQHESMNNGELTELTAISDRVEVLNVRRMESLAELARLRDITLLELLAQLGLTPPQVI